MPLPTLLIVTGPGGSGKTTLAHRLARAIGCPAISRDAIKEGMVRAHPGFEPSRSDPLTQRTLTAFFDVVELLLRAEVTLVAEAAFQDKVWRPRLEPLAELAALRIIVCTVPPDVAVERMTQRLAEPRRAAHADLDYLQSREEYVDNYDPPSLDAPTLRVDTTNGYQPGLAELVAFAARRDDVLPENR